MKVKIDHLSPVEKKLSISVPEEYVQTEMEKAYQDLNKNAKIPGFRSGKVPRALLEKRYGASLEADVLQDVIRGTVSKALEENKLDAVHVSEIMEPKRVKGEGFSYIASVEVKPEFEAKDYLGVKIEGEKVVIDDAKVEEALGHLRESQAVLKPIEGATQAKKGQFATLSVKDLTDANATAGKDQLYEVGSEHSRKEIDDALKTLQVGESAKVSFEDESTQRKFEIEITLKGVKEKVLPAVDDELAKSVGPFASLDELKERLKKDLHEEARVKVQATNTRKVLDEILKKNPLPLPKSLVHQEVDRLCRGVEQRMKQSGIDKFPEGFDHEKMHEDLRPDAERNVHEQLLLEAIARKENIQIAAEEILERIRVQAQGAQIPVAELEAYYRKTGGISELGYQILVKKTLDFLLTKANIKE